ncbi:AraC family transcriptional regulator [Caballeronia sp. dw_276]|uniref:AraC family transcriptional regulator n=1 Tax=Caballeronia sp. dw_276 TaxID=2719795 RepID=UPI001BD387A7|nr:AraC family transcriptional regulator [Caballeronia sp. dw_276]
MANVAISPSGPSLLLAAPLDSVPSDRIISINVEQQWRVPNDMIADVGHRDTIVVSRWTRNITEPLEAVHQGSAANHCIAMTLRGASLTFVHGGTTLVRGRVPAGTVQITAPAVPCSVTFQSPADVLHLFVSQSVLRECFKDLFGRPQAGDIRINDPKLLRDPVLERLGQALAVSQSEDANLSKVFTDSVGLAIVSRIVSRHFTLADRKVRGPSALPNWRLSRAIEYVDGHLSEPICLADMASSAGLTRMHFASQFRRATGLRPHEYLLRRRIEHAQQLLIRSRHSVLDVALGCGFKSQAHFTTVFKRLVGETPFCWKARAVVG